ncbi:MAG: hypothetical protein Q9160_000727 [Pyrenula sp. 1 TL-2023]
MNTSEPKRPSISRDCEGYECIAGDDVPRFLCLSCGSTYCDVCWERQGPHRPGKVGLVDHLPHEKTERNIYERLVPILEPSDNANELTQLHIEDQDTTWFGVQKDENGLPDLLDHGRYAALMAETKQPSTGPRYPQLVSFVGQTGAGKSTLIKMLVSLKERKLNFKSNSPFRSPVVGSVKNDKSPTSGDVHLYADPATAYTQLPILYADCEGLEGGEVPPVATQLEERRHKINPSQVRQRLFSSKPRKLAIASENPEANRREWAVKHLYPRFLYTFSDAVVFVLRNTRTFESSALKLLLDWAATSVESSINQPALPRAVIVLNATDLSVDQKEWEVRAATENLMAHVQHAVDDIPFFIRHADHWRKKGRVINNTLDLIRCYYADISVVRIPARGRYMLTDTQITKLHLEIQKGCNASFAAKDEAHMLSTSEELNSYLQAGFDHFTSNVNQPFNFVEVAMSKNPIPRDFGDHVLGLASEIRKLADTEDGPKLFDILSYVVASCIFLDCRRQRRPSKAQELFDRFYAVACTSALDQFCHRYWPCSFVSRKGKRCVNFKATHNAKGHQTSKGKIIQTGDYQSNFSPSAFKGAWEAYIKRHLQNIENEFQEKKNATLNKAPERESLAASDDFFAYDLHQEHLEIFYCQFDNYRAKDCLSLTTCLCCLMEIPQHSFQCGHTLCTTCVKAYGEPNDLNSVTMHYCPLHKHETLGRKPRMVHFKPDFAGVRVLSLDGTGGIIALGLAAKQWEIRHCIEQFIHLSEQAFTSREFRSVAGAREAAALAHGSRYKSEPLQRALKSAFGRDQLYGGPKFGFSAYDTKVAVTASSGTGESAIVLANYSRQQEKEPNYRFEFPPKLRIWEAASATSAAPGFFKPFESSNGQVYLDGALFFNNPVKVADRERKFLWPDVADNHPDIVLSIGTAKNGSKLEEEMQAQAPQNPNVRQAKPKRKRKIKGFAPEAKTKLKKTKPFKIVLKFFEVLHSRIDNILDSEREWHKFRADAIGNQNYADIESRYVRVNVDLGDDPPRLDEKSQLKSLQADTANLLRDGENMSLIETTAHKLVASSFYFLKESIHFDEQQETYTCKGRIACRFEGRSAELRQNLRELGVFLQHQQGRDRQPYFSVKASDDAWDTSRIDIREDVINDMVARAQFHLDQQIEIRFKSRQSSTTIYLALWELRNESFHPALYPISGFPRRLVMEDSLKATRLDKRGELMKQRHSSDPKLSLTSQSSRIDMVTGNRVLSPASSLRENASESLSPRSSRTESTDRVLSNQNQSDGNPNANGTSRKHGQLDREARLVESPPPAYATRAEPSGITLSVHEPAELPAQVPHPAERLVAPLNDLKVASLPGPSSDYLVVQADTAMLSEMTSSDEDESDGDDDFPFDDSDSDGPPEDV